MKGIAHFASGLCIAAFVPGVVADAAQGGLLIALAGACAMLPDLLDFRFAKFLERRDADIVPAAEVSDSQAIADGLAAEIAQQLTLAAAGPARTIQLHPLRRGVIDWVTYHVRFDSPGGDVVVELDGSRAVAPAGKLEYAYDGGLEVGELGGPSLRLAAAAGVVRVEFLPWHRQWSHSLVLALALGLLVGAALGPVAGWVAGLGYAVHVLEDQLGFLGSNLFWPLSRRRTDGLKLIHSGDAIPNAVTVWLSLSLLLLNLDRARDLPLIATGPYLAFAVVLPAAALVAVYARRKWRAYAASPLARQNEEALAESVDSVESGS
jgi:hypothetical protein